MTDSDNNYDSPDKLSSALKDNPDSLSSTDLERIIAWFSGKDVIKLFQETDLFSRITFEEAVSKIKQAVREDGMDPVLGFYLIKNQAKDEDLAKLAVNTNFGQFVGAHHKQAAESGLLDRTLDIFLPKYKNEQRSNFHALDRLLQSYFLYTDNKAGDVTNAQKRLYEKVIRHIPEFSYYYQETLISGMKFDNNFCFSSAKYTNMLAEAILDDFDKSSGYRLESLLQYQPTDAKSIKYIQMLSDTHSNIAIKNKFIEERLNENDVATALQLVKTKDINDEVAENFYVSLSKHNLSYNGVLNDAINFVENLDSYSNSSEQKVVDSIIRSELKKLDPIKSQTTFDDSFDYDDLNEPGADLKSRSVYGQSHSRSNNINRIKALNKMINSSNVALRNLAIEQVLRLDENDNSLSLAKNYLNNESEIKLKTALSLVSRFPSLSGIYRMDLKQYVKDVYDNNGSYSDNISNDEEAQTRNILHKISINADTKFNPAYDIFYAIKNNENAFEEYEDLLRHIIGNDMTDIIGNKRKEIASTPMIGKVAQRFIEAPERKEKLFLDAFIQEIKKFHKGHPEYNYIAEVLRAPELKDEVDKIWEEMYAKKDTYVQKEYKINSNTSYENLDYISDKIKALKNSFPISEQDFENAVSFTKSFKICEQAVKDYNENNKTSINTRRAADDMAAAGICIYPHAMTAMGLFKTLNKRPGTYGSSLNTYHFDKIAPIAKRDDIPEWMAPLIMDNQLINLNRLGSTKDLFDACKAWNISPNIWKKEAIQIGKMPLATRVVAGAIADRMHKEHSRSWKYDKNLRNDFWIKMKEAQDLGFVNALNIYAENNAETKGRIISILFENMPEDISKTLRGKSHVQYLLNLDYEKFLDNQRLISERDPGYGDEEQVILGTVKATTLFGDKFAYYMQKLPNKSAYELLSWLPNKLDQNKSASFVAFIEKNLLYKDNEGNEVMRPRKALNDISNMWEKLSPQQEEMNFERLVGLSYTLESKENIEKSFQNFLESYSHTSQSNTTKKKKVRSHLDSAPVKVEINESSNITDNLQLWQKFALHITCRGNNDYVITDEKLQTVMEGNRTEVLSCLDVNDADKKILTDLIIGNRHDINPRERQAIAELPTNSIVNFSPSAYLKAMNELFDREMKDPEASKLFYKNYISITSEESNVLSEKMKTLKSAYMEHRDWMIPAAIAVNDIFASDNKSFFNKIDMYNKHVEIQIKKQTQNGAETIYSAQNILNIHDAVYWLPKNLLQQNKKSFVDFVNKQFIYADVNGNKHFRQPQEMEIIAKNWDDLTPENRTLGFKEILAVCRSKIYSNQKYSEFAEEAGKFGIQADCYKQYENAYEAGLRTPTPFDTSVIFEKDGLKGRFFPRNDPRVGFFGNYTGCCQHFGGIGSKCAISSVKDSFSQLFAIENSKGEIIAGSWVWTNKVKKTDINNKEALFKTATFDNVEAKLSYKEQDETIRDIYKLAGKYLAEQDHRYITIGTSNSDMKLGSFEGTQSIPLHPAYSGYSDADCQVLLLENPNAKPLPDNISDLMITGACQEDLNQMQMVADKCFPDGDRAIQLPEDPQAMLLKDGHKTVGYVIWTENENNANSKGEKLSNWIYDMAVLPEYRKGTHAGSALLLGEMMHRVKEVGGEWGAELRDSTSLRYMRAMAGRNVVKMEELGVDHKMSDGSEVVEVKFSYIPEDKRDVPQKNKVGFMDKLKKKFDRNND